jgi:hypothetical protein
VSIRGADRRPAHAPLDRRPSVRPPPRADAPSPAPGGLPGVRKTAEGSLSGAGAGAIAASEADRGEALIPVGMGPGERARH